MTIEEVSYSFKKDYSVIDLHLRSIFALLSEHGSHLIAGHVYAAVCPHLKGKGATLSSLQQTLQGRFTTDEIAQAIQQLLAKGHVVEGHGCLPQDIADFWQDLEIPETQCWERLRKSRVWVEAFDATPLDPLKAALKRMGLACTSVATEANIGMYVCGSYLCPEFAHLEKNRTFPWLPIRYSATRVYIGPVFQQGSSPCWNCLAMALSERRQPAIDIGGSGCVAKVKAVPEGPHLF